LADVPTVGDFASDEVVTCRLEDEVGPVAEQIARSPFPFGLVTASNGVVLGRLRSSLLDCDPRLHAEQVMQPGPKTFRPHKTAAGVGQELGERNFRWAVVTTPEGVLIGVATRAEMEAA
jgi:hypothetical protein